MTLTRGPSRISPVAWLGGQRFLKFGTVGAFGVLVNLAFLSVGRELLFAGISRPGVRLNLSLAFAILCATISNFAGNRRWTWRDRRHRHLDKPLLVQFGQYSLACWLGIVLQVLFTNILEVFLHYLAANLLAIALASTINYLVNDSWTFGKE